MRRTIFTTSLLSALSCLCTQGYSQVGIKPVPDQSLIGQATNNARDVAGNSQQQAAVQLPVTGQANAQANAQVQPNLGERGNVNALGNVGGQTNITGQLLQNQSIPQTQGNFQTQGNINGLNTQTGINSQTGLNGQAGRINSQARITGQNTANAGAQQLGGRYPQSQSAQGWQNSLQSPMSSGGSVMSNNGMTSGGTMMSGGMQGAGPVYLLQHESSGREFICVNGSRVYFDQPGSGQMNSTNQLDANTGAVREQRAAGYGNYDQTSTSQAPQQPTQVVDPKMNKDSVSEPSKKSDAKPELGVEEPNSGTQTNIDKDSPTLK